MKLSEVLRKWVTLEIDPKEIENITTKEKDEIMAVLEFEVSRTITDMSEGKLTRFTITNLPRRSYPK